MDGLITDDQELVRRTQELECLTGQYKVTAEQEARIAELVAAITKYEDERYPIPDMTLDQAHGIREADQQEAGQIILDKPGQTT